VELLRLEQHPTEGKTTAIRPTLKFDDAYPSPRNPSQPRGWETREILKDAGYRAEQIEELLSAGAAIAARK
jgi:crotonobetainyl-CoA:carnitine CoA-transferase CaiB-like acyl-CoA transferase